MKTKEGKIFDRKPTVEVIDYIRSNTNCSCTILPRNLELVVDNNFLFLNFNAEDNLRVLVRKSFFKKITPMA